jgi:SAM-dependent methyltransferase
MEVIDLCSGDGWFTLQIAKIAGRVTEIDIDPSLLEVARHRLTEAGANNCNFVAGDAYTLDKLVSGPVDFVFMANAFHGVPDRPRLARAVRATLKPGGRLAIVNWHQRPREETMILGEPRGPKTDLRLSPQQTIEAVEASGLKLSSVVEVPPYHYAVAFERPPARENMSSILETKNTAAPSVFQPAALLRGARRQKNLTAANVRPSASWTPTAILSDACGRQTSRSRSRTGPAITRSSIRSRSQNTLLASSVAP